MSAGTRYADLMARAAQGDQRAARALLVGQWWPGDPDSATDRARVIRAAQGQTDDDARDGE